MAKLKVMTWNVLYKERADNILKLVKEQSPDVLCCQEITSESHINQGRNIPAELGEVIGNYRYVQTLDVIDDKPGSMGNAIFSKYPIKSDRIVMIQELGAHIKQRGYSFENRAYLEAELSVDGVAFTVGTTHMSFSPNFEITPVRQAEADKLFMEVEKSKSRYLITGDFNAAPNTSIIRRIGDRLHPAGPDYTQNTFTTKPFKYRETTVVGLDWRLDYIFVSPDIKVLSSEIIRTEFSDHLPILAEIEI